MDPAYFDRLFRREADPWGFETSAYEAAKYAATLDALGERYGRAFEVGCANGAFTVQLAARCDALLAADVAEAALDRARQRTRDLPHVEVVRMAAPDEWPEGAFGLVVVSEVGYYLSRADLGRLVARCADSVAPGGHLVLVHWTGPPDYPLTADDVHDAFLGSDRWRSVRAARHKAYRLDVLERTAVPAAPSP